MRASLKPMDDGQGVSREPLSVVALHQDQNALQRAEAFYQMMEQEFGDDFCFDCVYWPTSALQTQEADVTHDASEADLIVLAVGSGKSNGPIDELSTWLSRVRDVRHAPFSLVCLTDDPLLATAQIHADLQDLAGHFSMVYLDADPAKESSRPATDGRRIASAVTLSPVLLQRLVRVDPHPTGGIND